MEKLNMKTTNIVDENIKRIGELFPNCLTERLDDEGKPEVAIDFDQLRQELSKDIVEGQEERYQFTWPDKRNAIRLANAPTTDTLRPARAESVDFDNTKNLYIEGDNLQVLKILRENYLGKVKMIYIDPPYNTGGDFVYNDDFAQTSDEYIHNSGQLDEEGNRLFANTENNGRFHTDWLNMIYPRLKVAKDLLSEDGVIFISIDDNEVENLKKICDEVFGVSSFINLIVAKTKGTSGASGGGEDKRLKKNVEFVLCYGKSEFKAFNPVYGTIPLPQYIKEYNDSGKSFKYTTVYTKLGERTYYKTIQDGAGEDIVIYKHSGYETKSVSKLASELKITEEDVYKQFLERICTTENAQSSIRTRVQDATDTEDTLYSIDYYPVSGRNKGTLTTIYFVGPQKRLISWFNNVCIKEGDRVFKKEKVGTLWTDCNWNNVAREGDVPFPNGKKSLDFIKKTCDLVTTPNDNCIVLDFFSGSATTAHAVMQMNADDAGNRKFILVQIPENLDVTKIGYQGKAKEIIDNCINFLDDNNKKHTICELGKERIRRAGKKIKDELQAKCDKLSAEIESLLAESKNTAVQLSLMEDTKNQNEDTIRQKQAELDALQTQLKNFDTGFRVLKLDTSNMEDVYYTPEEFTDKTLFDNNIKPDRTDEDLLFQTMIDLGIELSASIERMEIAGKTVWNVAENSLLACFDTEVNESTITEIARQHPYYFVMRDSSLANDNVADNFEQIFEHYSKDTIRRII